MGLRNQDASPEQFAEVYAAELGLVENSRLPSHTVYGSKVQVYQKSLFLVGHPSDGSAVQDDDLRMSFLPSLTSAARAMDQVRSFTPTLITSAMARSKRMKKSGKRSSPRGGNEIHVAAEVLRFQTANPSEPIVLLRLASLSWMLRTLALAAAVSAPTSRRAAAAASLTIANMVASENGTAIMPLQKPRGLFKAPEYPQEILHPRAQVTAPTPTTAIETVSMLPSSLLENDAPPPVVNNPPPPSDAKATAKKARESEREAREKEFVDGQHANVINGIWHCSNCGCPESIAIGRRKGPLGDKSQCGTCGKFWHRHRRPRPVQYNPDPEYHLNLRNEESGKTTTKKRGRGANSVTADGAETPSRQKSELCVEVPTRPPNSATIPPSEDDRPVSPVSTASSVSEAPLAQQSLKTNGASQSASGAPRPTTPDSPRPPDNVNMSSPGGDPAPYASGGIDVSAHVF
ncbi:hypothetical protein JVU11DRAFT_6183 [Chiua virens]|nr:hypothetical protein JVU11DRAFT_6183 [Chiua virens]